MINFIDYRTKLALLAKDSASKQFEHVLMYFENPFKCCVHCLRADGGGEYKVVYLLCKTAGVRRQSLKPIIKLRWEGGTHAPDDHGHCVLNDLRI